MVLAATLRRLARRHRGGFLPCSSKFLVCSILVAVAATHAVHGQTPPAPAVAIALVLAVDASGSVDSHRFDLQKRGYAAAFRSAQVQNSIRALATPAIAVTMMQWTGPRLHVQVVDWSIVKDEDSANEFAAAIEEFPRQLFGGGTSISGAIDFSRLLLAQCQCQPARRVIDISGDGSNNSGRPVRQARDEAVNDGVGINGLPILAIEPDLDRYYFDNVIGGPGAFVIPAANYEAFADAIQKKLITEIAAAEPARFQSLARDSDRFPASQTRPSFHGKLGQSGKSMVVETW